MSRNCANKCWYMSLYFMIFCRTAILNLLIPSSSPLIVSPDSFSPWTWAHFQTSRALSTLADVFIYFWYTVFITLHVCNNCYGLSALVGCWSSAFIRSYLQWCPFDYTTFWIVRRLGSCKPGLTKPVGGRYSYSRPKSVHNHCVIKVCGAVFVLSHCFLDFSMGVGAFVIGLSQISSFFSSYDIFIRA